MVDRNESVRVIVRIRPLSEKEKQDGRKMYVIHRKLLKVNAMYLVKLRSNISTDSEYK